ncbi:hypothetical protein GCM10007103_35060 [Salinimicrobium marinum]|uniref:Uncharacterized protein n=1 Tax=Salinimicrobium marinum TaxID=680283 RepID=A0A918W2L3_9FLAO|nr:hypothetical protein [Salinimicrobium marinum]GHA51547.1 hypothetical protein GCM10007103_35060 [Salinimicrobium marinum]
MTIDYNWFFASFAQCGAALIAIIGAFTISKLLGEGDKKEIQSNKLSNFAISFEKIRKKISNIDFEWYDETLIEISSNVDEAIKSGVFENLNRSEKLKELFKIEPNLFRTDKCILTLNKVIREKIPEQDYGFPHSIMQNIEPVGLRNQLELEREKINELKIESEYLIANFNKLKLDIEISKKGIKPLIITLIFLIIGVVLIVIYPLHFLPLKIDEIPKLTISPKILYGNFISTTGILLIILTVFIEGLFIYFLVLIFRIQKSYGFLKLRLLPKYFELKSYSKYFRKYLIPY